MVDITCRLHPLVLHDHFAGSKRLRCTVCDRVGTLGEFLGPVCPGPNLETRPLKKLEVSTVERVHVPALVAGEPAQMETAPVETTGAVMPSHACTTHEDRTRKE